MSYEWEYLGPEKLKEFWKSHGNKVEYLLV